jgi:hypothetical protein
MSYSAVVVYDLAGAFLGYSIKQDGVDKLLNNNLWSPDDQDDLKLQLKRLNDATDIRNFWPDVRDPEVQALLDDPEFQPLELSPVEVVDEENSVFIWIEEPSEENPFGKMDPDASIIVHKNEMAPSPARVQERVKNACEIVARRRAGA